MGEVILNTGSGSEALQAEVDAIANELKASVVVSSRDLQSWVASPQGPHIDDARKKSLIERKTPAESRSWVESFDLDDRRAPFIMHENAEVGLYARVCVPVRSGDALAFVWMIPHGDNVHELLKQVLDEPLERRLLHALIAGGWGNFHSQDATSSTLIEDLLSAADGHPLRAVSDRLGISASGEIGALLLVAEPALDLLSKAGEVAAELGAASRVLWAPVGEAVLVLCDGHAAGQLGRRAVELLQSMKCANHGVGMVSTRIADGWARSYFEDLQYAATVSSISLSHRQLARVGELGHWEHYRDLPWTEATLARLSPQVHRLMQRDSGEWVETLESFLDTNGDVSECCKRLHIHRTTLHYRMGRIREIVGDRLDSGSGRADLLAGFSIAALARVASRSVR